MCLHDWSDNELSDTIAILNGERFVAEVDEEDSYLTSIIAVDRAGSIEAGDTMP